MSYDSLVLATVVEELQELLAGARVQRVYEISRNEALLQLHHRGKQPGLLLSCHARHARVHLTYHHYDHPETPSPFCMLLRKYLVGGRIREFKQPPLERVLEIYFDPPEAMQPVKLVAEIMGRRSNLILVDQKDVILGALKTASWEQNPKRAIQPGEPYRPAPPQHKLNPLSLQPEELQQELRSVLNQNSKPGPALVQAIVGLSPLAARELLHRSGYDRETLPQSIRRLSMELQALFKNVAAEKRQPVLAERQGQFAAFPLTHLPASEQRLFDSMNELLDTHYHCLIKREENTRLRDLLNARVCHRLTQLEKKLREQRKELEQAEEAPLFRLYGETLLTYSNKLPRGVSSVRLPHLYHPDKTLEIPLNPALTANENSRKYFNRYRKAKKAREFITDRISQTQVEISYCQSLLYSIESADSRSLAETRQELVEAGYLREKKKKVKHKELLPQPLSFKASSGRTILVGVNNRQNDFVTFKAAARRDTWLHIRELPGSHVIIKEAPYPPPEEDLIEAAFLAAYFSRAKESSAAAVDYTQVRHVRRAPGGKPGFVLYDNFNTITVNPGSEKLKKLLAQNS